MSPTQTHAQATFGGGCFWCVEAVFAQLDGVLSLTSGYSGGHVENPSYEALCRGSTGHAEVVHITFDPARVSYEQLLQVFWATHDPTTPNRQGNDVGTQYRSVIFVHDEAQRRAAETCKLRLQASDMFEAPIVTEITAFERFYPAEAEHQAYYARNPTQPYCDAMIPPKLRKLESLFADLLRPRAT